MSAPNVAFCRNLIVGTRGDDVIAHKRALSHAEPKLYQWREFTPLFGAYFERAVKEFQRRNGIRQTGRIGRPTHELLERTHKQGSKTEWAFQPFEQNMMSTFCDAYMKAQHELRVRGAITDAARFWLTHAEEIAYSQERPFSLGKPPFIPWGWDCSAFVTNCHYAGGAPDPNGRGYDHQGYTGTLQNRGALVGNINQLQPGDLIFYGYTTHPSPAFPLGSPTHVALYEGVVSGVPSVISNGSHPMRRLPYAYRRINHFRHYDIV